ncbi:MAG TPA: SPOR domain-containing protein [Pyrinomonadaceae bacterium]|nr:SPOR domain-containing protein [Pyrinomonadaceae bacterium]
MSRVFEELTAAVYEQQNRRKRELNGTAVERDLIARFHRVRQTEHAFPKASSPPNNSTTNEGTSKTTESEINPNRPEFPMNEHERHSEDRDFHFKRTWVAALLAAVPLIMVCYAIQKRASSANTTSNSRQQNVSAMQISDGPGLKNADTRPAKPELSRTAATDARQFPAEMDLIAPPVQSEKPNKTWSVQVSAKTSKETADKLAQQLKSEGYTVYVVPAEVKGQTYHRVRIGPFSAQEEAESVRQSLTRHDAYRDAYLATD